MPIKLPGLSLGALSAERQTLYNLGARSLWLTVAVLTQHGATVFGPTFLELLRAQ